VVRGEIKAFVGCKSKELLMHYEALKEGDEVRESMLAFTREFIKKTMAAAEKSYHEEKEEMTGHLSFDFLAEEDEDGKKVLYAIECNPRAHTAVVLFGQEPIQREGMARAYLEVLNTKRAAKLETPFVTPPTPCPRYYWVAHDIVTLAFHPLVRLLRGDRRASVGTFIAGIKEFSEHVLFWQDGTYAAWDPLPWWWLCHVFWPARLMIGGWHALKLARGNARQGGGWWSRVNVSTGKVFAC
jgi:hypothetical protein